ncbi:Rieske 2Fe-2S domain-containing protein [Micrococcales bacterium 31B]|nr:Rieske 2Fe-2S domain-containing protein [Micrococcales bacterium 31B]
MTVTQPPIASPAASSPALAPLNAADLAALSLDQLGERLDDLQRRLTPAAPAPDGAEAVAAASIQAHHELHRRALTTMVKALKADPAAKAVLFDLVDAPEVAMVLQLHGIVRPNPLVQVNQALETLNAQLGQQGADVALVSFDEGRVTLRYGGGAAKGCSAASLREGVEDALRAAVPSVREIITAPNQPSPTLIPLSALTVGPPQAGGSAPPAQAPADPELAAGGWFQTLRASTLSPDKVHPITLRAADETDLEVIVVSIDQQISAYVNECAHQGLPLDNALVVDGVLTCNWHGWSFDACSGECMSMQGAQLATLDVRVVDDMVWVKAQG